MKILVVDDSKTMRMIVIRTLKQAGFDGHTIIQAGDGAEAFELIKNDPPDVVLTDWNMPEMKGIDLLRKVREAGNQVKFGFVTSESSSETKTIAQEAGADFVLTKPFTADQMEMTLEPFLV